MLEPHQVSPSSMRPQGVLTKTYSESIEEPVGYFRPRPALDQDWFQMPKPPKLAQGQRGIADAPSRVKKEATVELPRSPRPKLTKRHAATIVLLLNYPLAFVPQIRRVRATSGFDTNMRYNCSMVDDAAVL